MRANRIFKTPANDLVSLAHGGLYGGSFALVGQLEGSMEILVGV